MAIRVRFRRTELSEGTVEVFENVDYYAIIDDNTIELRKKTVNGKYKVVGHIHPDQWESVHVVVDA